MTLPEQVDLIVVGGGLAGHCAALEAADRGLDVLLLEKQARHGGSTVQSSGSFAFAGTQEQADAGFTDDDEGLRADIMKASGDRADPALVDLYVRRQRQDYAWLKSKGVEFHKITLSSNQAVPRTHPTDPEQLMRALNDRARQHPHIAYATDSAVDDLVDGADGIRGVRVNGQDVRARAGVVLAAGGFSRNPALVGKFVPRLEQALALGGEGNQGKTLLMAWKRGADLVDMAFINGTFGVSLNHYPDTRVEPGDNPLLRLAIYKGAIAVNRDGRRFADESISYKVLGEICLSQPGGFAFQVFDQPMMDQSQPQPNSNDLKGALEAGLVRTAPSIRELAASVGIDADTLEATVARYNAGAAKGVEDEFGRCSLGKGFGKIAPIATAPFYIYPCTTATLATYCGLRVDDAMRVIDVFGQPIAGLYAAGEIVGGFHGSGYMSGSSLSKAAIFGRVAGETAAAALAAEADINYSVHS